MLYSKYKKYISLILSSLLVVVLLFSSGATPARASTLQSVATSSYDCPDSLWVTGTENLTRLWEQYGVNWGEGEGTTGELDSQTGKEIHATNSFTSDEDLDTGVCAAEEVLPRAISSRETTEQQAPKSIPQPPKVESQGVWGNWRDFWDQMLELWAEFPELRLGDVQLIWDQIERLRVDYPSLSFEEAKEARRQISGLRAEIPDLSFEEAKQVWVHIRELQQEMPDLSLEDAAAVALLIWELLEEIPFVCVEDVLGIWEFAWDLQERNPELNFLEAILLAIEAFKLRVTYIRILQPRCTTIEGIFGDLLNPWPHLPTISFALPEPSEVPEVFFQRASQLLSSQGFEDTDGDGHLNWPPDTPFEGQNLDVVLVLSETAGIAIAFVPVGGDIYDGAALVLGKDHITGECLTKEEMILLAISIVLVLPISGKTLKIVWKQLDSSLPLLKKALINSNPGLSVTVRRLLLADLVDDAYQGLRPIAGEGAVSARELAENLEFDSFGHQNYRKALTKLTGVSDEAIKGFEAHHILPQEFEERFLASGFDTIHDPRLLVWVDEANHKSWSGDYGEQWKHFFEQNANPTRSDILEEAQELARDFGYEVLFTTSSRFLLGLSPSHG